MESPPSSSLRRHARPARSAAEYQLEQLDGAGLVHDVVEAFQRETGGGGHQIDLTLDGNDCVVRADREALGRALWNLLDNAVKYSPGCKTVWVDVARSGKQMVIHVRDRGAGIARGERDGIFRKFVRGAAAQTAGVKGTGIGLATVDHIVRAHGGLVRVESEPGRGSTFSMILPLVE